MSKHNLKNPSNAVKRPVFARFNTSFTRIAIVLAVIVCVAIFIPRSQAAGSWDWSTMSFMAAPDKTAGGNIWQETSRSSIVSGAEGMPTDSRVFSLNRNALSALLATAPHESAVPLGRSEVILAFPMPDGSYSRFRIQEAPVIEPSMEERFPEIKSYRALSIDDPTMSGRFDLTPRGFHANILASDRTINILPADSGDLSLYASYDAGAHTHADGKDKCFVEDRFELQRPVSDLAPSASVGPTLRTYRMAVSTTFEYTSDPALGGGTIPNTVASVNTWLNGINAIYEREVAARLILVNDTDSMYTANTDPYNDSVPGASAGPFLNQVRVDLRDKVGQANYNIGHVLTRNTGGGVAYVGIVCQDGDNGGDGNGPLKGGGVSVVGAPVGGSLMLLAHEIGHQFGGPHNFNGSTNSCGGGNRNSSTSYETGSGITIMSYAALCGADNVTNSTSELRFHTASFRLITDHIVLGSGAACAGTVNTGNAAPTVTTPATFNIPKNTPFTLTAAGSDPNPGDAGNLTYAWEQTDVGGALFAQNGTDASFNDALDPVGASTRPIFRSFSPVTSSARTFPSLSYILNNANDPPDNVAGLKTAEELPRIGRTVNFRVTARDQLGGVNEATVVLAVDNASGPFSAVDIAGPWAGGASVPVTWNVAGTTAAPVLAANVRITLSTDGGNTFPIELAATTPNDGSQNVTVPTGIGTTTARVKVEAVGNIFFDITGNNFTITPGNTCPVISGISPSVGAVGSSVVITGVGFTGVTGVSFSPGVAAAFVINNDGQITATVPAGAAGGPITLTEPGCGAAASSNFTVCPGTAATLQVDDGSLNAVGNVGAGQSYFVNRLTPAAYPATLSRVSVYFSSFMGAPVGTPITIVTGSNTDGDATINNIGFQTITTTIPAHDTFSHFDIAPITITSGDFVVGFGIINAGWSPVAIDITTPQNRSYRSNDGSSFTNPPGENYMIRANAFTGACSSGSCTYTVGPNPQNIPFGGGTGTVNVTTQAGCTWRAARNATWLTITSADNGTGSGTVTYTASQNYSGARSSSITVGSGNSFFENLVGENVVINQVAAPVAAGVSVSGRVLTPDGQGVRGAVITITGLNGEPRIARTSSFGYYRFDDVLAGETYLISVASKRYQFTSRTVSVGDELTDVDFVAEQ